MQSGLPPRCGNGSPPASPSRVGRRPIGLALALCVGVIAGCGSASNGPRAGAALVSIGAGLQGPGALQATVYAKGPANTSAFAFDSRGRLWLTAAGLGSHAHDGVYLIGAVGAHAVRVIRGLDDPLGILWYRGRLYVASVGRVDAYGGFDGRRFTKHTRILSGPVAGGENNLLAIAPSGRLVMGVTASCDRCKPRSSLSGAIVSFRPDGSDLRLYAAGIRAPVGLAFFPGTSDLFASMNQRDDLGAATPGDWLSLVREGESWGFPNCYGQGGAACAGVPKPTAVLDKHAAAGPVAIVTGQLGASVGTAAIVTEWSTGQVKSVALKRTASGYSGVTRTLLRGVRNPLALTLTPDGALLLGDWTTGTIYRISARAS
jgi:glucose/arabinose dehydrogenase